MAPRGRSSFPKDNHGSSSNFAILANASTSASHPLTPFNLHAVSGGVSHAFGAVFWKYTKVMNMRDLSRDDDYLSHLFVEKLGNSATPLMVHKMDPLRRLPKTDATDILSIVKKLIHTRPSGTAAVKQGVNDLLTLPAVRYFIRDYEQPQINAFATHATRYLELYLPTGSIEIAQTSRYSKYTGKNEVCILATRALSPGQVITELKGSMADLSEEEDKELKRTGARNDGGTRRDFSVIHSRQMKKNHLFLGPARFVNHDCDHNCELFRTGRYITFRVIKPIAIGQEITAHYGDGYFGRNNKHCLCETCERNGRGGYCPEPESDTGDDSDEDSESESYNSSEDEDDDSDDEGDTQPSNVGSTDLEKAKQKRRRREERHRERREKEKETAMKNINVNQRSTRRGVYLTLPDTDPNQGSSDSDNESDDDVIEIEDRKEVEKGLLDLSSVSPSNAAEVSTLTTPELSSVPPSSKPVSTISSLSSSGSVPPPVVIINNDVLLFEDRDSTYLDRIGGSVTSTVATLGLTPTSGARATSDDARLSVFSNDTGISTITNTNTASISGSASGSPSRSLFRSVITTRGQKAREASIQSQASFQSQPPSSRFVSVSSSPSPQCSSSLRLIVKPDPATQQLDDLSSLSSPPPSIPATTTITTTTPVLHTTPPSEGATVVLNADGTVRRKRGRPRKYPRPENESPPAKLTKISSKSKSKSDSLSSLVKASDKEKSADGKDESVVEKRLLRSRPSLPAILSSRLSLRNQSRDTDTDKSVTRGGLRSRNVSDTRFGNGTSSSMSPVRSSSLAVAENSADKGKGKEKPIPTGPCCKTCSLPLLSLTGQGSSNNNNVVVASGGTGSPGKNNSKKGKTKEKDVPEDCPRCQRHFIVYGVTWPNRTSNGQALNTPRELTPATSVHKSHHHHQHHHHSHKYGSGPGSSTKTHASHHNSKVFQAQSSVSKSASTAIATSKKRLREESDDQVEDLSKRRKLIHKPDIRKYGKAYAKAKLLGRTKVQITNTVSRVRPGLKSKTITDEVVEASSYETDEENQPREINGRFGRKTVTNGKFGKKKNRSFPSDKVDEATVTVTKRSRIDESEQDSVRQYKTTSATRSVKRLKNASANETDNKAEDEQQHRPVFGDGQGNDFDDRRDKTFWPALPPMPPVGLGFKRTGLLNLRPNPTVVSRWRSQLPSDSSRSPEGTPNLVDDTDDENDTKSDDHPATPDNLSSVRLVDVDFIESDDAISVTPSLTERGKRSRSDNRQHPVPGSLDIVTLSGSEEERDDFDDDRTQFRTDKVLPALKKFGLSSRPSPIALSKLKWAPKLKIVESDDEPFSGQRGIYDQSEKLPITQTSSLNSREKLLNVRSNTNAFAAVEVPPRNLTYDAGSPSSSSGEEDIILPGTSGRHLFTLQKTAAFATNGLNVEPNKTNDTVNVSRHSIGYISEDQCTKFNTSKTSAAVSPKVLTITGRLHSSFLSLSSPVAPSKLVDAGWESSSDASPEPLIA